jgi:hypothetical protein
MKKVIKDNKAFIFGLIFSIIFTLPVTAQQPFELGVTAFVLTTFICEVLLKIAMEEY